jgi:protein-S-isoprenylcysteine O-methyltransferase Ste14
VTEKGHRRSIGVVLVAAQVALCLALIWLGWRGVVADYRFWPGVAAGVLISAAGVSAMRLTRVKITPEPGAGATLCDRGIYRHIRHPMYAGLLLAFAMFALAGGVAALGAWMGLLVVLLMKLRIEERLWSARDAAYRDYQQRTKRLLPGVW